VSDSYNIIQLSSRLIQQVKLGKHWHWVFRLLCQ